MREKKRHSSKHARSENPTKSQKNKLAEKSQRQTANRTPAEETEKFLAETDVGPTS